MIGLLLNRYVIGAALAAFLLGGAYLKGRSDCGAKYEYAALKQERDALLNAIQTERAARDADAKRLADNEAMLRDMKDRADADAGKLKDADRMCFDPADTDSLREHFRTAR